MTKQFEAHDQHYASKAIEPILVQEQIMDTALEVPAKSRLSMAQAVRYLMRAGTKAGEDWSKELSKAENYIHRARTGEWIASDENSLSSLAKAHIEDIAKMVISIQRDVAILGMTNGAPLPIELASAIAGLTIKGKEYFADLTSFYDKLNKM